MKKCSIKNKEGEEEVNMYFNTLLKITIEQYNYNT